MLDGRPRAGADARPRPASRFVEANAEALPFADGGFDAYTIAFGIRNVPRIDAALAEAFRVLKPGGRFLCLEFSAVDVPVLDRLYDAYSFNVIPRIGERGGRRRRVLPLSRGIDPHLPQPGALRRHDPRRRLLRASRYRNLSGGIAALHSGWKL